MLIKFGIWLHYKIKVNRFFYFFATLFQ